MSENSDKLLDKGVFDLRAVLAGRQLPEETIEFYIDEELGHQIEKIESQLEELQSKLSLALFNENKDVISRAEKGIAQAEKLLAKTRQAVKPYRATIRAVTRRSRHDIQSKAMHKYPLKRDLLGHDDPNNELERNHYLDQLIWAYHLKAITSPEGSVQLFSGVDDLDSVIGVMDQLPESAYRAINKGIDSLLDDGTQFEWAAQNEDFSSGS